MKMVNRYFETVAQFRYLERTITNQNFIQILFRITFGGD
jgi:hypothetical protein